MGVGEGAEIGHHGLTPSRANLFDRVDESIKYGEELIVVLRELARNKMQNVKVTPSSMMSIARLPPEMDLGDHVDSALENAFMLREGMGKFILEFSLLQNTPEGKIPDVKIPASLQQQKELLKRRKTGEMLPEPTKTITEFKRESMADMSASLIEKIDNLNKLVQKSMKYIAALDLFEESEISSKGLPMPEYVAHPSLMYIKPKPCGEVFPTPSTRESGMTLTKENHELTPSQLLNQTPSQLAKAGQNLNLTESQIARGEGQHPQLTESQIARGEGQHPQLTESQIARGEGQHPQLTESQIARGEGQHPQLTESQIARGEGQPLELTESQIARGEGQPVQLTESQIARGEGQPLELTESQIARGEGQPLELTESQIARGEGQPLELTESQIARGEGQPLELTESQIARGEGQPLELTESQIARGEGQPLELTESQIARGEGQPLQLTESQIARGEGQPLPLTESQIARGEGGINQTPSQIAAAENHEAQNSSDTPMGRGIGLSNAVAIWNNMEIVPYLGLDGTAISGQFDTIKKLLSGDISITDAPVQATILASAFVIGLLYGYRALGSMGSGNTSGSISRAGESAISSIICNAPCCKPDVCIVDPCSVFAKYI